jgi:hypothetical protein
MPERNAPLYLAGEVRWCRESGSRKGEWAAGFQLLSTASPDFISWIGLLSELDS